MKQYHDLLQTILDQGVDKTDRTGTGTRSIFGPQMRFDLSQGFPLLTTKKLHFKSIIHELLWILKGDTNIKYLVDNGVNIWNEWPYHAYQKKMMAAGATWMDQPEFVQTIKSDAAFAYKYGNLGPVYGKQWRDWEFPREGTFGPETGTVDQIQQMVDLLKGSPDSRRMVVSAWNVGDLPQMALSPCHCLFQFYTEPLSYRERWIEAAGRGKAFVSVESQEQNEKTLDEKGVPNFRLSCQLYQRSADTFLGVPFNVASYALLTHMVAQVVNMVPGEFIWTGGDTHLYLNHLEQAKEQLSRIAYSLPTLRLNPAVTDLFSFKYEDITLDNYQAHPSIKAAVSV